MDLLKKTINAFLKVNITDYKAYDLENTNPFYNYVIIAFGNNKQANALLGYLKEELKTHTRLEVLKVKAQVGY